jgi:Fur family peroxide stress response transcriptional regulator
LDPQDKQRRIEAFEQLCRERGIPCTVQRRAILEAVLERDDHPTADRLFKDVSSRHRGIARATVHRTLETLVGMGLIAKADHPGHVNRYDPRIAVHHHLVCTRCDRIIDIQDKRLDALPLPDTSAFAFDAVDMRVQVRGICKECRADA